MTCYQAMGHYIQNPALKDLNMFSSTIFTKDFDMNRLFV